MGFSQIDWRVMRGALLLFVVALAVGGGLVSAAEWFNDQVMVRHRQQNKNLVSVRSSYQRVDDEKLIMEQYLPRYESLIRDGTVGAEQRLTWVESLRGAARDLSLPSMRYEIGAQSPYVTELPLEIGLHQVYRTTMSLDMGLFHEGDLPRVLQALERGARGLYSIDECSLERSVPRFGLDPRRANVSAACTINWFLLRQPDA